jgi:hypothetical protein
LHPAPNESVKLRIIDRQTREWPLKPHSESHSGIWGLRVSCHHRRQIAVQSQFLAIYVQPLAVTPSAQFRTTPDPDGSDAKKSLR